MFFYPHRRPHALTKCSAVPQPSRRAIGGLLHETAQREPRNIGNIAVTEATACGNPANVRFTPESGHVQCN